MEHVEKAGAVQGDYNTRFKYAYLYLHEVLPFTGVELGIAHRPWIDYEEHNSWFYRDTHWTFTEAGNSAKLSNSADTGVNFKTNLPYFSSEVGLYTGEGYHNVEDGKGLSAEWRFTGHLLGKHKKDAQDKETYWDASFFGQYNVANNKYKDIDEVNGTKTNQDLVWGGIHTVFNMPQFMFAAQYIKSQDTIDTPDFVYNKAGQGYSAHAVGRFGNDNEYRVVARYDSWTPEQEVNGKKLEKRTEYLGFVYEQSKNLEWVANVIKYDNDNRDGKYAPGAKQNSIQYMLTVQIAI